MELVLKLNITSFTLNIVFNEDEHNSISITLNNLQPFIVNNTSLNEHNRDLVHIYCTVSNEVTTDPIYTYLIYIPIQNINSFTVRIAL